jgi:hypothetical protein
MLAIFLVALFAAAALGSAAVLTDSAVRGRNAFRLLHAQLARLESEPRVTIRFADFARQPEFPMLRTRAISPARQTRHPVRSRAPSPRAAA